MLDLLLTYQRNSRLQVCINNESVYLNILSHSTFKEKEVSSYVFDKLCLPRALLISSKSRKPAAKSAKQRCCYRCCLTILILTVNLSKTSMIIIME